MGSKPMDAATQSFIARIAAVKEGASFDRPRAEAAIRKHLQALGFEPVPIQWIEPVQAAEHGGGQRPVEWAKKMDQLAGRVGSIFRQAQSSAEFLPAALAGLGAFAAVVIGYALLIVAMTALFDSNPQNPFLTVVAVVAAGSAASGAWVAVRTSMGARGALKRATKAATGAANAAKAWQKNVKRPVPLEAGEVSGAIYKLQQATGDAIVRHHASSPVGAAQSAATAAGFIAARSSLQEQKGQLDLNALDEAIAVFIPWLDLYEAGGWMCWITPAEVVAVPRPPG